MRNEDSGTATSPISIFPVSYIYYLPLLFYHLCRLFFMKAIIGRVQRMVWCVSRSRQKFKMIITWSDVMTIRTHKCCLVWSRHCGYSLQGMSLSQWHVSESKVSSWVCGLLASPLIAAGEAAACRLLSPGRLWAFRAAAPPLTPLLFL